MKTQLRSSMVSVGLFAVLFATAAGAAELFVAPDGSDANPGTADRPFATLARAKMAVEERVGQGLDADLTVWIDGGTYTLSEPLEFGPETGGTEQHAVAFRASEGADVLITGGRKITGWKRGEDGVWTSPLPKGDEAAWAPRNLFVAARRAVRVRTPNHDAEPNCVQLKAAELSADRSRFTLTFPPGIVGDWKSTAGLEVMVAGNWAINRKRVESVDPAAGTLTLLPPHRHGPNYIFPSAGRWACVLGAIELLDQPGEWHLDPAAGVVSYRPMPGEDMTTVDVVAPKLVQLIAVRGTPERPVRNLHFKGLRLAHTDWQLPPDGYMGIQACHYGNSDEPGRRWNRVPAAVRFADAAGCSVEGCTVGHLGGSGIELADGCRECLVRGNRVFDASANGIMIAGPKIDERVAGGCRVTDNHVHACGREFFGAIGIWVGFARGTVVAHNLVHDLPYTGISVGWEWNPNPTPCKENVIEFNHVYDVMNRLCDGGCIYTLGFQPGTIFRGNHLHGAHRSSMAQGAPNNGVFIDQGSKGYLFEKNVIYDTAAEPIRFNQCQRDWHTWDDNHIGEEAEVKKTGRETIEKAGVRTPWRD